MSRVRISQSQSHRYVGPLIQGFRKGFPMAPATAMAPQALMQQPGACSKLVRHWWLTTLRIFAKKKRL